MADRLGGLKIGGSYHGNAGIASAFAALADKKLKPGRHSGLGSAFGL